MEASRVSNNRVCFGCGSKTTNFDLRRGKPHWRWYGGYCEKCNNKLFKNPKYKPESSKRVLYFKTWGRRVYLKNPVRKGVCARCLKSVIKGEIKLTHMHHIQYDLKDPLAYTIELCNSCHKREHERIKREAS
jgi:hypothetical protein